MKYTMQTLEPVHSFDNATLLNLYDILQIYQVLPKFAP